MHSVPQGTDSLLSTDRPPKWRVDVLRHTPDAEVLSRCMFEPDDLGMNTAFTMLLRDLDAGEYLRVTRLPAPPALEYERDVQPAGVVELPPHADGFALSGRHSNGPVTTW